MEGKAFQKLFAPIKIGNKKLKSRIVMTPVQVNFSTDGTSNERYEDFFEPRARSGVGLVMVEPVMIDKTSAVRCLSLYEDRFIPPLAKLVETIHSNGALAGIQINHLGRQGDLIRSKNDPPLVAPSPLPWSPNAEVPKELSRDEIEALIEKFAEAARRVRAAAFDLVEIHGAHGYLVSQFLSPLSNIRKDEFGGDARGRAKFAVEIIKRVREKVKHHLLVSCRINGADNIPGGLVLEDAKAVAPLLVEAGLDLISISAGVNGSYPTIVPGYETPPGCYVPLAEGIKSVVDVPVLGGGCIGNLSLAEEVLEAGKVDLIGMTRALIADPEMIQKTLGGEREDIRKCIQCNTCIEKSMFGSLVCLVNPEAGKETEFKRIPAVDPKSVVVVGGGLAGLEAARVAASRGHHVRLYEEGDELGGQWRLAATPPHKEKFIDLIHYLAKQIQKLGVEVRLGKTATAAHVAHQSPDVVVVATGGVPSVPTLPGMEQEKVITAHHVLRGYGPIGKQVLIVGGGGLGLETADFLQDKGKEVTVVEILKRVGKDVGATVRWSLLHRLRERGIRIFTSTKVDEMSRKGIVVTKNGTKETWQGFDTIVLATGVKSRKEIVDEIKGKVKEVYVIGDAAAPRRGVDAMREGAEVGRRI
ncbi:MAG: FAD-dependent oxidoreductase [Desulfobacteraceae bacterium]|jgi:2,4-dienoyl-CoA reductase-like NADH-dependent reductase (Old Yellow Enzyme family)/NADPH-dependent 2,4-dienoyl-CoA reductase/sulfur reductase-like enzyme